MNAKMKYAVAAVAMAIGGTAHANIDRFSNDAEGSDLFFSILDTARQVSYILDIDVNLHEFVANDSASYTISMGGGVGTQMDEFLSGWSGNNADLQWAVMAGDSVAVQPNPLSPAFTDSQFLLSTSSSDASVVNSTALTDVDAALIMDTNLLANVNGGGGTFDGTEGVFTSLQPGYFSTNAFNWYDNVPFSAVASAGEEMAFYLLERNSSAPVGDAIVTAAAGTWLFDATTQSLTYGAAAVPVPAAVWLLGSALVGLVGVSRRKQQLAAA